MLPDPEHWRAMKPGDHGGDLHPGWEHPFVDLSSTTPGSHRTQQSMVLLGELWTKCIGPEDGASKPCSEPYRRVKLADQLLVRKGSRGVWGWFLLPTDLEGATEEAR